MYPNNCDCNDYAQFIANNGVAAVTAANSNIDGSGTVYPILTAGASGSVLKSIIVKATAQSIDGFIRLYITNGVNTVLIDEIRITAFPILQSTPTPTPVLPMFVAYKTYNLMMGTGDSLVASTQNAGAFNVIAEALDVRYPAQKPTVCCAFKQEYPLSGGGTVSVANANLDGTGTIVDILTSPQNHSGAVVNSISISALQATQAGMIRLFLNDGANYHLMNEIFIPQTSQSTSKAAMRITIPQNYNLKTGYGISASTQNGESFAIQITGKAWLYV